MSANPNDRGYLATLLRESGDCLSRAGAMLKAAAKIIDPPEVEE